MRQKLFLGFLAVLLALPFLLLADTKVSEGASAPDFTLPSQDGTPIKLSQYRGHWVVLYFYPKDFTSGCTMEAHKFQEDQQKYAALHAVVLGVSVDSADSHKQFCTKEGLSFKLLSDQKGAVAQQYDSLADYQGNKIAARHTFLIDPHGKIVKTYMQVNPSNHSQEVLAALQSAQKK